MQVLHVNSSDTLGGAARAAYRIHRCLVDAPPEQDFGSEMRVILKRGDDPTVSGGFAAAANSRWQRWLRKRQNTLAWGNFQTSNSIHHSIAWPASGLEREINRWVKEDSDRLLHLHWVGEYFGRGETVLSIEEIGKLHGPVVWTLHDQWAFCGAEHYADYQADAEHGKPAASHRPRFVEGYSRASRPGQERGPDINRRTWLRKRRAWTTPMTIVCPSSWLADEARRSALMHDWPIHVIPYPLDLNTWAPVDRVQARVLLDLPTQQPLLLFGALGGAEDPRKGADLLMQALRIVESRNQGSGLTELEIVIFGQGQPKQPLSLPMRVHYAGSISDDLHMRLLYAAADVMVVPSRQEAFGQTASEAQACGTPVVAFRAGGLADIVDHESTGALAEPFDPASLAASISWVLEDKERAKRLREASRRRAEHLWAPSQIAARYREVYRKALQRTKAGHMSILGPARLG